MSNNPKQGPDLESIIGGLSRSPSNKTSKVSMPSKEKPEKPLQESEYQGRLWDEFVTSLNDDDASNIERSKLYAIDDDIVETLHQCSFGKPNVHVINSILRTFLIDNIPRLRAVHKPRSASLLDKYQ